MIYIPNEDVFSCNNGICVLSESEINSVTGGMTFDEMYEVVARAYDVVFLPIYIPLALLFLFLLGEDIPSVK